MVLTPDLKKLPGTLQVPQAAQCTLTERLVLFVFADFPKIPDIDRILRASPSSFQFNSPVLFSLIVIDILVAILSQSITGEEPRNRGNDLSMYLSQLSI